jgi:hypothetical protein
MREMRKDHQFFHTTGRVKADAIRIATPWRRITESIIRLSRDREGGYNPYNHMLGVIIPR